MTKNIERNLKDESLSIEKASREYRVNQAWIMQCINSGQLEYLQKSSKGKNCLMIFKDQLKRLIVEQGGTSHLDRIKAKSFLREVNRDIAYHEKYLVALKAKKEYLNKLIVENQASRRDIRSTTSITNQEVIHYTTQSSRW